MAKLKDIVKFLDNYLKIDEIKDSSWNGLQIEGKPLVNKVVFAENASADIFKKAVLGKADLIIVHHGHFWKEGNPSFRDWAKERLGILLKNEISLYACHLPLDCHKKVGNNAQLLKLLGARIKEEFGKYEGQIISFVGEFKKPIPVKEIVKKLTQKLKAKCTPLLFGPEKIKTIAVCSGGGGYGMFFEALNKKVDLYLTGDTIDVYTTAKDAKFNVIFAGHYATETVGLKALMTVVKKKFSAQGVLQRRIRPWRRSAAGGKVKTIFIDDPTEL